MMSISKAASHKPRGGEAMTNLTDEMLYQCNCGPDGSLAWRIRISKEELERSGPPKCPDCNKDMVFIREVTV